MSTILKTISLILVGLFIPGCYESNAYYRTYNPAADNNAYIAQGFNNYLAGISQWQQPERNYQWYARPFIERSDGLYKWNAFNQQYEYTGYNPQFERLSNDLGYIINQMDQCNKGMR